MSDALTPEEIEHVEEVGFLDKNPVKMIRTKGGFWIAVGRPRGKYKEEALAAGSHPAVVKYNLEKQFSEFKPSLMKSEAMNDNSVVDRHSHWLDDDLRKSGHDIYSIQNGNRIEFQVTQHNTKIASIEGHLEKDSINFGKLVAPAKFGHALAGAASEKALSCNAAKIKVGK